MGARGAPLSFVVVSAAEVTPPAAARPRGNADLVLAWFVGLLLISNVGATKLIKLGPFITDGGALLFPLTYVLGDVLAEVYGFARARRAIVTGFLVAALMSVTFLVVDAAPPAPDWPHQDAWSAVLGFVPRIVVASLLGFLAGQVLNAVVLVRLKRGAGSGRLWVRLVTSTVVGEFADTAVFCLVAFGPLGLWLGGGSIGWAALANYVAVGWAFKVGVEVLLLPVTYRVIAAVRRHEPEGS